jgi:hypothetical protein
MAEADHPRILIEDSARTVRREGVQGKPALAVLAG